MKIQEQFISGAKRSPEIEIADEYRAALADAERAGQSLSRYLRISKDGKPVYADGVEVVAAEIERASERLEHVKTDIREYLSLLGDHDSVQQLIENANRHRRALDNVDRDAKNLLERSIKASGLPPERAQDAPEVQASMDKRDRLHGELTPIIADLSARIKKAQEITRRY
jgi:hypothetical protein